MVLLHLDAFVGQNLTFSHQISVQLKTSEHFRAHFFVFRAQFLTKRRHFRPDPFLSCAERWQDLRAVRDSRGPCSERGPFLARSPRGVFPNGCLRGISDAWRAYLAKASPFSDAWRANLARKGRFSRPRPLSGCMERKTCHGLPPGNAPRRNPATARHSRTHRARILPLPVRPRAHQGAILPPSDAGGGRTARAFCHRRAPGNAPWRNLATTSRPRTHFAHILPSPGAWECIASISCHRQTSENVQFRHTSIAGRPVAQRSPREGVGSGPWLRCGVRRATLSVRGSGHSAFSGLNCWERFRVCAVSVGNHELASRSAKLCRIMC